MQSQPSTSSPAICLTYWLFIGVEADIADSPEMTDTAKKIAQVLSASKVNVRLDRWNDFKEDGDGYLGRWVSGPTFVFAESVPNEKITEYEAMIVQSGAVPDTISRHKGLLVFLILIV